MSNLEKIILFYSQITQPGGGQRLLFKEAKYFQKRGVKTKIITFDTKKEALFSYKNMDLEIIGKRPYGIEKSIAIDLFMFIPRVLALIKKLKEITPDIVIAQDTLECTYLYLATKLIHVPYVTHIHGTMFWYIDNSLKYALIHRKVFNRIRESVVGHREFTPKKPPFGFAKRIMTELYAILDYLAVRKAKRIITPTNQLKWEIKLLYNKDAVVSRGCVDPRIFNYKPKQDIRRKLGLKGKKIILNIGRLDPRKRIDLLIKSFAKLCQKHSGIVLLIGGIGEEEKKLKKLVKDLHVENKVKFLGLVTDEEYFDYFAACNVFAFPSWTTSGIPPYEALAMGKNVVWTTEADEPVLTDKHVFLADPTVEDFSKAMEKALNTKVGEKPNLSGYTWDKYFSKVYSVCEEAVKAR